MEGKQSVMKRVNQNQEARHWNDENFGKTRLSAKGTATDSGDLLSHPPNPPRKEKEHDASCYCNTVKRHKLLLRCSAYRKKSTICRAAPEAMKHTLRAAKHH
jgi:hypothetical protein